MDSTKILEGIINAFLHKLSIEEVGGELFIFTPFQDFVGERIVLKVDDYTGSPKKRGEAIMKDIIVMASRFNKPSEAEDTRPAYNNNSFFQVSKKAAIQ
jgi:hypothetical protein